MLCQNRVTFTQAKGGPSVSHLSFADDVVIFASGKGDALETIMKTLEIYEGQSGQCVNKSKSGFYVHEGVGGETISRIERVTKYKHKVFPFTYLGCPIYRGRKRVSLFASLVEKIAAKCRGWHSRLLSQGGKSVLIKSVLQGMPMHIFSALDPPKAVIKQIEMIFANFFWGNADGKLKHHWSSWESMSKATENGGVGLTSIREMVAAAATKLWWHFRTEDSLWRKYLEAKYCSRSHPVAKTWQYKDSHIWRRMVGAREKIEKEIQWKVGKGDVNFWWDDWSGLGAIAKAMNIPEKSRAKDTLKSFYRYGRWCLPDLGPEVSRAAEKISLNEYAPDTPLWKPESNGVFSFASAKKYERQIGGIRVPSRHWSRKIWAKHIPWKMAFLAWRVFKRKVPLDDILTRFGYNIVSACCCCQRPKSCTLQHVFCTGEAARAVWSFFANSLGMSLQVRSLQHICYQWWKRRRGNRLEKFMVDRLPVIIIWELWVNFTGCKYGGERSSEARTVHRITKGVAECIARRWPAWDAFPFDWHAILKRTKRFGVKRVVERDSWCKPPRGWIKVNHATSESKKTCSFFVRNATGQFCLAGVYTGDLAMNLRELRKMMAQDIWAWCRRKRLSNVMFEGEEGHGMELNLRPDEGEVKHLTCRKCVNCIASCLANRCEGENVLFLSPGGLPHGFQRLLELEGLPHFTFLPGQDLT
ncbi:PREDICTED: uncharacterized protein LOC109173561 [Ipomoea nil]|uniref:uncharacterized protein LOC109173561 n=1 Tax=Ipomoea nil TaxID=35883 RepID=UPI0009013FAF|nr:PREDICTED: uncharacterized protein LOC109173561 [Ipomoea nil]